MQIRDRLAALVEVLPVEGSVTLPASTLREWLDNDAPVVPDITPEPQSWRERLWAVPPETRIGVREVAEAVNRSADWVYRATSSKLASKAGRDPLPCRKLDGELTFTAGSVRTWLTRFEVIVNAGPSPLRIRA